jgi:putative sterol carrier protein
VARPQAGADKESFVANPPSNIKDVFAALPTSFNASAAKGLKAVYQFNLTGDNGGKYTVAIDDGQLTVDDGAHVSPNITITIAASDYLDMMSGKLNPQMAFMSGKLKIAGDMGLAMKMQSLFPHGSGPGTED